MASKIDNIVNAFSNTKLRVLLVVILVAIVFTASIFYIRAKQLQQQTGAQSQAVVARAPNIVSIPGVGQQPPRSYVELQEKQNIQQAEEATRMGTAAVPSVTRVTYLPSGVAADTGSSGCSAEELKRAHNAGVAASELRCRGCSLAALRAAGYTAGELRDAGFSAKELKDAGFSAQELKDAGFNAKDLKDAGFTAADLKNAGYSAGELKDAGYSDQELTNAGYTPEQLKAAGVGVIPLTNATNDCSPENLRKLRLQGIDSAKLKAMGCSISALKAAGFTAAELKAAGFSAKDLKDAGFSAAELKNAGFSAKDLKDAGFSAKDLKNAGYSAGELKSAGFSAGELKNAGFSANELKDAGFNAKDLRNAGYSADDLAKAGYSSQDLKDAGYSDGDLMRAGISVPQIPSAQAQTPTTEIAGPQLPEVPATAATPNARPAWEKELDEMRKQQAAQLSSQEYQDKIKQLQQLMSTQANQLFTTWIPLPNQQYVQGPVEQQSAAGLGAGAGSAAASQQGGTPTAVGNADVYKAGTILFAVLDTSVNSDMRNSPVMATIVQGPLKGSKVLGNFSFSKEAKSVLLQFTVLSSPQLKNSIGMSAVAIDPNTAHTALASNVDNHYLLRYGGLFAASFISGLGQAAQEDAQSVTINTGSGETIQLHGGINTEKSIIMGLGDVGNEFANAWRPLVNTPPTVTVNGGTGLGLLLMSDLAVPKS